MNDEEIKIFQLIKLIICLNLLEIYTMKEQMSYIKMIQRKERELR